ncbi:MAG: hypothetical protein GX331_05575 [Firmicutes bacterium]|nr:hypothetical protein [Bacillota bacterium]
MMVWLQRLLLTLVVYVAVPILVPMYSGHLRENYQGNAIPMGLGLAFVLPTVIAITLTSSEMKDFIFGILILFFALLGFVDDMLGYNRVQGFQGHFSTITSRRLSTGGFKALAGGVIALAVSSRTVQGVIPILISGFTIALSANLVNLLDRRPGRAAKFFFLFALLLILVNRELQTSLLWLVVAVVGYVVWDLKGTVMMGDTGANPLGAGLGFAFVQTLSQPLGLVLFAVLILLNAVSERVSFSKIIESNRVLSFLDRLGRS